MGQVVGQRKTPLPRKSPIQYKSRFWPTRPQPRARKKRAFFPPDTPPLPSRYPYPPVPSSPTPPPLPCTGDPLQRRRPGLPASLLRADSRPHLRRNRAAVAVSEGAPAAPLLLCRAAARTQTARSRRLSPESNTPPHQSDASRVSRAGRTGSSDPSSAEARGSNLLRSSFACAAASVVPGLSLVAGRSPRSIMEWRDSFLDLVVTSLSLLLPMAYSSFMYL
ncbi:hypothetical protein PVAP13_7KG004645 [Panicum virgatum]|uniref:Uncharacterized protein n=1 Tax=Panicum virgatum TaxID=38727 RepID=A0A8T0QKH8_PANVG|nr:hypothetical protein PVAP13_7KG004645 [Panicum virgatum]